MRETDLNLKIVETMIIGSLKEFVRTKDFYRTSTVGVEYCHVTDEGKDAINAMFKNYLGLLHQALAKEEIEIAKQHMMDTLKK